MKPKYRLTLAIVILVLVVAIIAVVALPAQNQVTDNKGLIIISDTEYKIVIPSGTYARIERGETPTIIHNDIVLTLGRRDRLTLTNEDDIGHTIGLFYVAPGQTISQQFSRPEIYEGTCSFQGGGIRIIVQEA